MDDTPLTRDVRATTCTSVSTNYGDLPTIHTKSNFAALIDAQSSKPAVKQHLAAIRMLFDWLVTGHIMETNPAHAVRGPKHSVRKGKTSVLSAEEMHELLAAIDNTSLLGFRDRALIALRGSTFARVGAATGMRIQDYYVQKHRVGYGSTRRAR